MHAPDQRNQSPSCSTHLAAQEPRPQVYDAESGLAPLVETLTQLERLRQRKVLFYLGEDQEPLPKRLDDEDVLLFYEALRPHTPLDQLDLVLTTSGGNVTTVRKLLQILHAATAHLTVLVPCKAQSAGTILCLGAHHLVLTPFAELSPIDPHIEGSSQLPGRPTRLSSQDIASFRTMAQRWFGIDSEEAALAVLKLLSDKLFPPALTQFFRAEQLVRQVALEALRFQLPQASAQAHQQIVEHLLNGYPDHQYPLTQADLLQLGLQVTEASPEEERLLWLLWKQGRAYLETAQNAPESGYVPARFDGLFLSSTVCARHLVQIVQMLPPEQEHGVQITRTIQHAHWEMLD